MAAEPTSSRSPVPSTGEASNAEPSVDELLDALGVEAPLPGESPGDADEPGYEGEADLARRLDAMRDDASRTANVAGAAAGHAEAAPVAESDDPFDPLMAAEFESVAEVLEGVFEDQAVAVGGSADEAEVMIIGQESGDIDFSDADFIGLDDLEEDFASDPRPAPTPVDLPDAPVALAAVEIEEDPSEFESPSVSPISSPPPVGPTVPAPLTRLGDRLEGVVVALLAQLNYPIRALPDRYRPMVDWLALSLVFWVGVVWVFALLVAGE